MQVSGLQRRVLELETSERQSRELLQDTEAHRQQSDRRHRETTAQLEEALHDARVQVQELSEQAGLADTKVQGLEEQLGLGEARCRDLELKLDGLFSALRRTVGTGRTGLTGTAGSRRHSPSPWRVKGTILHFQNETML